MRPYFNIKLHPISRSKIVNILNEFSILITTRGRQPHHARIGNMVHAIALAATCFIVVPTQAKACAWWQFLQYSFCLSNCIGTAASCDQSCRNISGCQSGTCQSCHGNSGDITMSRPLGDSLRMTLLDPIGRNHSIFIRDKRTIYTIDSEQNRINNIQEFIDGL